MGQKWDRKRDKERQRDGNEKFKERKMGQIYHRVREMEQRQGRDSQIEMDHRCFREIEMEQRQDTGRFGRREMGQMEMGQKQKSRDREIGQGGTDETDMGQRQMGQRLDRQLSEMGHGEIEI